MTDSPDYERRIEDRKAWNRLRAEETELCKYCGGPMEETMIIDPVNGVDYYDVCKNPNCPIRN